MFLIMLLYLDNFDPTSDISFAVDAGKLVSGGDPTAQFNIEKKCGSG